MEKNFDYLKSLYVLLDRSHWLLSNTCHTPDFPTKRKQKVRLFLDQREMRI
jgi:hypothetical protein